MLSIVTKKDKKRSTSSMNKLAAHRAIRNGVINSRRFNVWIL